ncbi:MAG: hypothetical protein AB9842_03165 [Bacteroidales bacterium]
MKKLLFISLLTLSLFQLYPIKSPAQHPEIGFSIVLSGALLFGPYYNYWVDDHQCISASIMAAWEEEFKFPFALNAGYGYYFGDKNWRPSVDLQYSLFMPPKHAKRMSILTVLPGVQYRWAKDHQNTRCKLWVSSFLSKEEKLPWLVMPIGLQFDYGYKYP